MDQEHSEHGEHGEVHLPDPSVWPLVVGLAALLFGFALVFWSRDRHSALAGPLLGAAALAVLIAAAGWAYEDGRMKKKAEEGIAHAKRDARFTQVLTFAVAEGRLDASRSGGILEAIERSDSALRDLNGFQDMRIIVSPATTGPSQTLVETTWSNREGLATYEETRQTMLDLVAQHPDDVVPGSVQVFDMEVVRDTKDVSFRFGMGAAFAVLGSLAIGGFMVGAGLTLFENDNTTGSTSGGGGTVAPANDNYNVTAVDTKFNKTSLEAPPNTSVTFTFTNNGQQPHNLRFLTAKGGQTLAQGAGTEAQPVKSGESEKLTFTTPAAGTYYFQCDFHPDQMNGTFTVKEGAAPPPGAAPAGGGAAPAGSLAVTATDNKFDKTSLQASTGAPITVQFTNSGKVLHNLHFYDKKGGQTLADGAGSDSKFVQAGQNETLTFTAPGPGTFYFQCDLHPDQMNGTLTVAAGSAPPAGAAPAGGGAPAGGVSVNATDNKFDKTTLQAAAGGPVTVQFTNNGKVPHNLHFYDKKGGQTLADGAGSDSKFIQAGQNETLTFTPPGPGTYYYQCDLHPDQMNGTLTVK